MIGPDDEPGHWPFDFELIRVGIAAVIDIAMVFIIASILALAIWWIGHGRPAWPKRRRRKMHLFRRGTDEHDSY